MSLSMDSKLVNHLQRVGLNKYESKAYLALLDSGPLTASGLSEKTDIPRPRTYDILKTLKDKGLASIQPGRPAKYDSNSIEEAMENLKRIEKENHEETLREIDEVKGEIKNRVSSMETKKNKKAEDFMWFLKDKGKIDSKLRSLLQNAKEEIVIATDSEEAREHLERYESLLKEAKKRGTDIKIISEGAKEINGLSDYAEVIEGAHNHRFIGVDDHSILFLTPKEDEEEVGAWIKSPYFTKNLKNRFDSRKNLLY